MGTLQRRNSPWPRRQEAAKQQSVSLPSFGPFIFLQVTSILDGATHTQEGTSLFRRSTQPHPELANSNWWVNLVSGILEPSVTYHGSSQLWKGPPMSPWGIGRTSRHKQNSYWTHQLMNPLISTAPLWSSHLSATWDFWGTVYMQTTTDPL